MDNKKKTLDSKSKTQSAILNFLDFASIIHLLIFAIGLILPIYQIDFLGLVKTMGIIGNESLSQGSALKLLILPFTFICSIAIQMLSKKAVNGELDKKNLPQIFFIIITIMFILSVVAICILANTNSLAEEKSVSNDTVALAIGGILLIVAISLDFIITSARAIATAFS